MGELNKQNPEKQAPAQNAAADKRAQKKAQRKARKAHYKQLRKEIRKQKQEAFKAKTFLGKTGYVLRKILAVLFVVVTLATVVRVNLVDIAAKVIMTFMTYNATLIATTDVTQEQIEKVAPMDEERGALIDASAPLEEGETWAIYLYMVGSDLETKSMDQLSDVAKYISQREAIPLQQEREETLNAQLYSMVDTMLANGMDLPNALYVKNSGQEEMTGLVVEALKKMQVGDAFAGNAGTAIIEKIMAGTPPENVKLVLQPGGAKGWKSSMVNPNRTQRFVYDSQGMHKVYEGHLSNMADPQTLADFLTFCKEEYPADHTMVVMFNHGNAAFGYGRDAIYLEDNLTLKELRWAFDQVYELDEENPPIDVIGFDACIMASMEVADALNGVASYMVATEEVQIGYGWDYTTILNRLAENPRMNPLQLSRVAVDSYMDPHAKDSVNGTGKSSELCSILDLRYADDLYQAYSDFASAALKQSAQYAGTAAYLGNAANKSIKFAGSYQNEFNTLDLGLFMQGMDEMLQQEAQAVLDVLDEMVLYNRTGNLVSDATGITVYYPASLNSLAALKKAVQYIEQICDDPAIRALYYYKVAGCLPQELQAYAAQQGYEILPMDPKSLKAMQKTDVTLLEDGNMLLPLTQEAVTMTQEYRYHLLQMDENGIARRLGDSSYLLINENGDLQSAFDGRWVQINGINLQVKVVSGTPTSLRYAAQVRHNGTLSNLLLGVNLETQEWYVIGIQPFDKETSNIDVMIDRNTKQLKPGDILIPVYEQYDIHTGVGTEVTGKSINWREDIRVEESALPDGDYMSYISLVDARGDVYDMQVTSFTIHNGTMGNGKIVKMR